jgi:phytoene synthase
MISADRARLVAHARRRIARGSRSFSLASRLFDRETRERAWLLYAWCRACDDLVDGQELGFATGASSSSAIDLLRMRTEQALAGIATGDASFDGLALVAAECAIPRAFIEDHLDGFALDAAGWRPATLEDLLAYCYKVAGVVGCMMALVMGVDPEAEEILDRASDLGIAFQLANIMRDIRDDHAMGRCYLPSDWLDQHRIAPADVLEPRHRKGLAAMVCALGSIAAAYERSARVGARSLPFRSRWAVLAAAEIYGSIAVEVCRRGTAAWDQRVMTGGSRKLGSLFRAWREARDERSLSATCRWGLWTRTRSPAANGSVFLGTAAPSRVAQPAAL